MWFLYLLGFIILIIGAFRGGNNTGDIVRKGASGLIKAIIVIVIILVILISYLSKF